MIALRKSIVRVSAFLISSLLAACGNPEQKFAITVTDENGRPLNGVNCSAGFNSNKANGNGIAPYIVSGKTNAEGKLELSGETVFFDTSLRCRGEGYYDSLVEKLWITGKNGDHWDPWPVEVNLVMKKIHNPKPMFAVKFDNQKWHRFPNKKLGPFGFDLMHADWVQPYGKGEIADFVLEAQRENEDDPAIMPKGKIILRFSNPSDGIFLMEDRGGSVLSGPSILPDNSTFLPRWVFENFKTRPNNPAQLNNDFSNEVYVFRVRTRLDEKGAVEGACYGKIDGRIVGWLPKAAPSILMTYYFNGTPNDRCLEWDMKNNLIRDTSRIRVPERP